MAENVSGGSSTQFIRTQNIALASGSTESLREGSFVFVRVISQNGKGNYTVSFGGNRFNVSSAENLIPGQTFKALVHVAQNSQVQLVIQHTPAALQDTSSLASMLFAQGFNADDSTRKILSFFQQSGFKIDRQIVEKARRAGLRFPGKEKLASEVAAILLEKGLDATDELILQLMEFLDDNEGGKNKPQDQQDDCKEKGETDTDPADFLSALYSDADRIVGQGGQTPGLLSMLNQIKTGARHWIFLPYEYSADGNEACGSGIIRLLLNLEEKQTEKIEITYKNSLKYYSFVLYYTDSKVKEIRFCTLPPLLTPEIHKEEKRLGELFSSGMNINNSVPVTYSSSALIEGFCANSEDFLVFDQKA